MDKNKTPTIVHQIWMHSDPIPELQAVCMAKNYAWCESHGYEHCFWQKSPDNNLILKSLTSGYGPIGLASITTDARVMQMLTDEKLHPVMKSDIMRFLILYEIGGFYADLDLEIINLKDEFLDIPYVCGIERPRMVICTAFIGSQPRHPANMAMVNFILSTYQKMAAANRYPKDIWDVLNFTGPDAYTKILKGFPAVMPFPPEVFYPLPPYSLQGSVTMHYFKGSKKGGWVFDKCKTRDCNMCDQRPSCNIIKENP